KKMLETVAIWGKMVSSIMLIWAMYSQYIPRHIRSQMEIYFYKLLGWLSFYVHINLEGVTESLLALQVTELKDGVLIGYGINHLVADGASFWSFFKTWTEICSAARKTFPPLPLRGWFLPEIDYPIRIPISETVPSSPVRVVASSSLLYLPKKMFRFTRRHISELKAKANAEVAAAAYGEHLKISSFQAVLAHMWRSIIRNSDLDPEEVIHFKLPMDLRQRLNPPLQKECFGNMVGLPTAITTAGEMLDNGLGWAALQLDKTVRSQTNEELKRFAEDWVKNPKIPNGLMLNNSFLVGSSPRFNVFGNDFGWGKPIAVRAGPGISGHGRILVYPGTEQRSMEIQTCLWSHVLDKLLADAEFLQHMLETVAIWGITAKSVSSVMLIWAVYSQYIPRHVRSQMEIYFYKLLGWLSFYVHIKFTEHTEEGLKRSENYNAIRNYLSTNTAARAQRLKANESKNSKSLVLSMDDHEEVEDVFNGVKVKWYSNVKVTETQSNYGRNNSYERRFFTLTFHRRHRGMIIDTYITHVLREGKAIGVRNRERKLYTNNSSSEWYPWMSGKWSNVPFHHPATFETLAMDPEKKERIKKDLVKFSKGKDYYKKVGKAWKRGYLLFGLLNSIDGLWSACSDEKIIIFTTNFVDKLDPALIRRGRMDNHIEMSYCRFEAFKVLAKNYLEIESHELYGEIERLLEETDMSPADVAETLMPKSDEEDADVCIKRLVKTVEEEKEKAKKLAEEEEKSKAEKEEKRKKKKEEEADNKKTEEDEKKVKGSKVNGDLSEKNVGKVDELAKEEHFCFKGIGLEELKQKLEEET
ncbi:hypothetical protein HID58_093136, partial [Brassica napus]